MHLDAVTVLFGANRALKEVSARFNPGGGLLGPNGSGKSTMLQDAAGVHQPTHGRMTVLGLDVGRAPMEIRARIGYMPEERRPRPRHGTRRVRRYCGELAGLPAVDAMQRAHEVALFVGSVKRAIATSRPIRPA